MGAKNEVEKARLLPSSRLRYPLVLSSVSLAAERNGHCGKDFVFQFVKREGDKGMNRRRGVCARG